ncbi:hypothetical protein RS130_04530 [Paraglaciecola aquimarina]|uniref:Right handed beta helix domain-containing protein n=1 Tax=Paraglaciecola aquimarina TaxID=1235557 RepID=A0ABU3STF2_9ALTE|nr:hypothetical protein [Paraglaciecola aquimarina]MDU0353294.1 hypothetical protein [Paraglaciecola aquimarina]
MIDKANLLGVDNNVFPHLSRRSFLSSALCLVATTACSSLNTKSSVQFIAINSLDELRHYASVDNVKVRLNPGVYTIEAAESHKFMSFTGKNSHYDLRDVTLRVDTKLFSLFGDPSGADGFYRVIDLSGENSVFEGLKVETFGDKPGYQSRNKIFNIVGSGITLKNVDVTTSGSTPWGYGSLYGIKGTVVRKMNGIRVGWPAVGVKVIGCKVHMRAMGHAIFVQGAIDTLIENCHVDGLVKTTNDLLAEKSGYAYDRHFKVPRQEYVEGVTVGKKGEILPNEIIALSEDGIRLYGDFRGHVTGSTTIRDSSVYQMRRGICTGLGAAADVVENCEATDCIAAGFNIGNKDRLINCRANAKYAEALSCPYEGSSFASVDLDILDSRNGLANNVLATINGDHHRIKLHTKNAAFVPSSMLIAIGTRRGYAFYQQGITAPTGLSLENKTAASVIYDS